MMTCGNCSHAKVDHATGKCVNRQTKFDPAVGAVTTLCPCKAFEEPKKKKAFEASKVDNTEDNTETVGTAPTRLTAQNAPSTKTTVTGRK